ncbi:MAG: hypothetical protein ABEI52_05255 [Halobacteriaceae archaeon]
MNGEQLAASRDVEKSLKYEMDVDMNEARSMLDDQTRQMDAQFDEVMDMQRRSADSVAEHLRTVSADLSKSQKLMGERLADTLTNKLDAFDEEQRRTVARVKADIEKGLDVSADDIRRELGGQSYKLVGGG